MRAEGFASSTIILRRYSYNRSKTGRILYLSLLFSSEIPDAIQYPKPTPQSILLLILRSLYNSAHNRQLDPRIWHPNILWHSVIQRDPDTTSAHTTDLDLLDIRSPSLLRTCLICRFLYLIQVCAGMPGAL